MGAFRKRIWVKINQDRQGSDAFQLVSNALNEVQRQQVKLSGEIKNIALEITELKQQVREYQQRVERTPNREKELMTIKRDYENIQESFNPLLNRMLESEIAVNIE